MFNPPAELEAAHGGANLEWIEIFNDEPTVVHLTGYYFSEGVNFTFPFDTYLEGRSYLGIAADAEAVRIRARETLRDQDKDFKCQRQLMSGGTCEASAFAVYGYQTTGIAFPLGNYHNGAPEDKIEAEYIHIDDYLGGVELITEAARRVSDRTNTAFRQRLREVPDDLRQRLLDTSG